MNHKVIPYRPVVVGLVMAVALMGMLYVDQVRAEATQFTKPMFSAPEVGELAYVTIPDNNELVLIDINLHTTIDIIDLTQHGCFTPTKVRITPDGTQLYVICTSSTNIIILDTETQSLVATISNPDWYNEGTDVAFTQDGGFALVSATDQSRIDVVNTTTHTIVQSILVTGYVSNITVHPYLPLAYAATGDYANGYIYIIDTNTFTIQTNIHFGIRIMDVHLSPDGHWLFASDYNGYPGIAVIDTTNNTIVNTFPDLGSTFGLDIMPDGLRLFAGGMWSGIVHVIDAVDFSLITDIEVGGSAMALALTCDGSELYVPNDTNILSVIDTQTNNVVYQIPLPGNAIYGIAICPQYVAHGAFLSPPSQSQYAGAGEIVPYTLQMINLTGVTDNFNLEVLPGNAWPTTLSTDIVGPIQDGESITFTAWVVVPLDAQPAEVDIAAIQATSVNSPSVIANATLNTTVTSGKLAYVTLPSSSKLTLIDTVLHTTIDTIDLAQYGCNYPQRARLNLDGSELYVMCEGSRNIVILATSDLSLVATIDRPGTCGQDVTFIRSGAYALASTTECEGIYQIDVIDTATHTVVQSIPTLGYSINSVATHPFLPVAYAGGYQCCWAGAVLVIDTNSLSVQTIIQVGGSIWDVQPSPDGQWIYTSDYVDWGGINKINAHTNEIVGNIQTYSQLFSLQITPDGSKLFVAGGGHLVYMLDAINFSLINSMDVGGENYQMELNCDGNELYVANQTTSLPVIDPRFNTIIHGVDLPPGSDPYGVAICPQYETQGIVLIPPVQNGFPEAGETITYTIQMVNATGAADSFNLGLLPGNVWTTSLSSNQVGPIADGESITFTAWVEVPPGAQHADADNATILVTSVSNPSITATTMITTTVTSGKLGYVPMASSNELTLIDTQFHATIDTIDMAQYGCIYPQRARLNPDSTELYVMCRDSQNIIVMDTSNNSLVATIDRQTPYDQDVAFVRNGVYALASGRSAIDVIDTATHTIVQSIPISDYITISIAAHPFLPLAYTSANTSVYVIDTNTFSIKTIIVCDGIVEDVEPSPDGAWLYASEYYYWNGLAKINANTNTVVDTLPDHGKYGLSISLDGSKIFASEGWDGVVTVIDADTMEVITSIDVGARTFESELSCDGSELYVAREAATVPVLNTQNFELPYDIHIKNTSSMYGIAICPHNVGKGIYLNPSQQNWFTEVGGTLTYTLQMINLTGVTDSFSLEVLPGNTWTTSLSTNQVGPIEDGESITFTASVQVPLDAQPADTDTATIQATSVTSPSVTTSATLNTTVTSGELAYVPMKNNGLALIDTQTHTTINSIDMAQYGCHFPQRARLTPAGGELYVMCEDSHNIVILDTTDLSWVATIERSGVCQQDVAFVQLGSYALASTGNCQYIYQIDVIDTATHTIVQSIPTSGYGINSISAHPFLPLAYAAGTQMPSWYNGAVLVIDTSTFTVQTILPYGGNVWDVQPSPDGKWVYASEYFSSLAKIDTNTNTIVDTFSGAGDGYRGLDISPDGSILFASGAQYAQVAVVDATTLDLVTNINVEAPTAEIELTCDGSDLYVARDYYTSIPIINTQTYIINYDIPIQGTSTGYGIAICPQYLAQGAFLDPPEQAKDGGHGEAVTYQETLFNNSGITETFSLEALDYQWDTQLSIDRIGPLSSGESASFTATVIVPVDVPWYDTDNASILASGVTSPSLTAEAQITTTAFAPAQIGVEPNTLESTQLAGEVTTQTLTINNGDGVTLTYNISEGVFLKNVLSLHLNEPAGSEIFYDSSDYGNDGTCGGTTCPASGIPGKFGRAVNFDGTDDYISVPDDPTLNPQNAIAISAWINVEDWNGNRRILQKGSDDNQYRFLAEGGFKFNIYNVGEVTTDLPSPGNWHHVVGMYDGSQMQIWIDGELKAVQAASGLIPTTTETLYIGTKCPDCWGSDHFYGKIDEILIFSRALSAEEIQALYQGWLPGGDAPWLSVDPVSGSVPPNGSTPVQVTFNATDLTPGVYDSFLAIQHNDTKHGSPIIVFVTLTVEPVIVPPESVTITGPEAGQVGESQDFTAWVEPISTTLPLTYVWEADGQVPITHTKTLTDTVSFIWENSGTQLITVTVSNQAGSVSTTYQITIVPATYTTYLPLVQKVHQGRLDVDQLINIDRWINNLPRLNRR